MADAGAPGPRRARCPRRSGLSRAQFEAEYLIPNRPCILTDQTVGWGARTAWTRADGSGDAGALLTSETMRRARVPVDESPQGSGYGEAVRGNMMSREELKAELLVTAAASRDSCGSISSSNDSGAAGASAMEAALRRECLLAWAPSVRPSRRGVFPQNC